MKPEDAMVKRIVDYAMVGLSFLAAAPTGGTGENAERITENTVISQKHKRYIIQ